MGNGGWAVTSSRVTQSGAVGPSGVRPAGCLVQFGIDGLRVTSFGDTDPFDVNHIRVSSVERIDVYLHTVTTPAGFTPRDALCGIVVIWTRERLQLD